MRRKSKYESHLKRPVSLVNTNSSGNDPRGRLSQMNAPIYDNYSRPQIPALKSPTYDNFTRPQIPPIKAQNKDSNMRRQFPPMMSYNEGLYQRLPMYATRDEKYLRQQMPPVIAPFDETYQKPQQQSMNIVTGNNEMLLRRQLTPQSDEICIRKVPQTSATPDEVYIRVNPTNDEIYARRGLPSSSAADDDRYQRRQQKLRKLSSDDIFRKRPRRLRKLTTDDSDELLYDSDEPVRRSKRPLPYETDKRLRRDRQRRYSVQLLMRQLMSLVSNYAKVKNKRSYSKFRNSRGKSETNKVRYKLLCIKL